MVVSHFNLMKTILLLLSIFPFATIEYVERLTSEINRKKSITHSDSIIIEEGKKWIKRNIESHFNNDEIFMKGFSYLCTNQYAEFKKDATNVGLYDVGMTKLEFKNKWGRRYSKYAGIGEGFMIAGTDFGRIEVTKCRFIRKTEMGGFLFEALIVDKTFASKFQRQVVLIRFRNSFLIDNVLEISNEFKIGH